MGHVVRKTAKRWYATMVTVQCNTCIIVEKEMISFHPFCHSLATGNRSTARIPLTRGIWFRDNLESRYGDSRTERNGWIAGEEEEEEDGRRSHDGVCDDEVRSVNTRGMYNSGCDRMRLLEYRECGASSYCPCTSITHALPA
jgi:hypothetical protein